MTDSEHISPSEVVEFIDKWNSRAPDLQESDEPLYLDQTDETVSFTASLLAIAETVDTSLLAPADRADFLQALAVCRIAREAWAGGGNYKLRGEGSRARSHPVLVIRRILSQAVNNDVSEPEEGETLPVGQPELIFISHAAADRKLAERVATEIEKRIPDVATFIASRPDDIPQGEWFKTIQEKLREADALMVLLTPNSKDRHWVLFEAGAGWLQNAKTFQVVRVALGSGELPQPFSFFQVHALEVEERARLVFRNLGDSGDDLTGFCHDIQLLAEEAQLTQQSQLLLKAQTSSHRAFVAVTNRGPVDYFRAEFISVEGAADHLDLPFPARWEGHSEEDCLIEAGKTARLELARTLPEKSGGIMLATTNDEVSAFLPVGDGDPDFGAQWFEAELEMLIRIHWSGQHQDLQVRLGVNRIGLTPRVVVA